MIARPSANLLDDFIEKELQSLQLNFIGAFSYEFLFKHTRQQVFYEIAVNFSLLSPGFGHNDLIKDVRIGLTKLVGLL